MESKILFQQNDVVYTTKPIYLENGNLAFSAYTAYKVYEAEDIWNIGMETVLINEAGMFHALSYVEHFFNYMQ